MNELIEKFAIDCAGQMVWNFPKDPEEFTFTRDELSKFAELIVQECSKVIEVHFEPVYDGKLIKQHFGVES
jgi:hypothetical protein